MDERHPRVALMLRRERLLGRSRELRQEIGRELAVWNAPLAVLDQARAGWRWVRRHPGWPLTALVLVAALRPRRAMRWLSRGVWVWRLWRRWSGRPKPRSRASPAPPAGRSEA